VVKHIEKAKAGEKLMRKEMNEWPAIEEIAKERAKILFTHQEECLWFRRLGVLENMSEGKLQHFAKYNS